MQLPVVSVIIPCYNCERYLSEAIESALAQTYPATEVIVIDDGSSDGSYAIAQRYLPRIRLLQNRRNKGRSWSRNKAIAESVGEYIALLDADDVWLPHKLEQQMAFVQEQPCVGLVYAKAEIIDELTTLVPGCDLLGWPPRDDASVTPAGQSQLLFWNRIPCVTALFRRDAFVRSGLFDNSLWMGEDYDLWLRMSDRNTIAFIDITLARYRVHSLQTTTDKVALLLHTYKIQRRHIKRSLKGSALITPAILWDTYAPQIEEQAGRCLWRTHEFWNASRLYLLLALRGPRRPRAIRYFMTSVVKGLCMR